MICPNPDCKRIVSPFDEACQHCGTALKNNPIKEYAEKKDEIGSRNMHSPSKFDFEDKQVIGAGKKPPFNYFLNESAAGVSGNHGCEKGSRDVVSEAVDILKIRKQIILQQMAFLENLKHYVFSNPHITTNREWIVKAEKTHFYFDWEDSTVNGGAGALPDEAVKECDGRYYYSIVILGGYVNFAYAIACAYSNSKSEGPYNRDLLKRVIGTYKKNKGLFSVYDIIDIMPKNKKLEIVGNEASKVIFECIAHELGHICYGHIHGPGYNHRTSGQNLGQEHDADSFAYAVIHASPSKKELWLGLIQFMIMRAAQEAYYGRHEATTHPLDIDRLKTAISRFPDLAKQYSIDEKWAEDIVNKIYRWIR